MDAFEHYDVQQKDLQKRQILEQKLKNGQKSFKALKLAVQENQSEREELAVFFHALFRVYARNVRIILPRRERQFLFAYETELISHLLDGTAGAEEMEAMKQKLYQACGSDGVSLVPVIEGIEQVFDMI